ncbi:gamma-carboxygeranoyl-CoA hydratase [Endozoicomonas sp. OPT23]|uniref:enoyl-CoA hydratase/isomerase family protein n=1 Tax=Endozoicomonas sp. OPT23 TaxID=2072845 RepID=UPI00129B155D|nr:enoyl-CoA hydratase/isomerase family protein [Endozoicomonas sp. OPT23]MRI34053.1 gamma-carboxygeranoyl-CoA hydratase [Endozoicomonas sp. OPT23]
MDMNYQHLIVEQQQNVASLILNRPEVGNAFNAELIEELIAALSDLAEQPVRALLIKGSGKHFSAGADLNWMKNSANLSEQENYQDSQRLALLLKRLNEFPAPTIAVVQGAAFGGAVGLASACDMAIGSDASRFCLSEVKIGLIPAVISPYVVQAMGNRQARRYFLTAEVISGQQAVELGLLHECVTAEQLEEKAQTLAQQIANNAPEATRQAKLLLADINQQPLSEPLIGHTCKTIAAIRVSEEGQEGLSAFLEKREPAWRQK